MAARARTARAKARREARKTQRQRGAACVRRTPRYMRDDGRVDAEVRAEIGKKMVGMRTPHFQFPIICLKVLEYLDFYRLCRVARVCKDWKILAGVMRKTPEQQFRAGDRTCSFLAKTLSGAALPFQGMSEVQCHADPVTNRLCQLRQLESGAEVVDGPGGAGVAGFVAFVDHLAEAGATGRGLICAQPEEVAKWREAFRDKPYLRKASFFSGGKTVRHHDQRLQVSICSRNELSRYWARFFRMTWHFFAIDDGSALPKRGAETNRILTLAMNRGFATGTTNCYHFCQTPTTDIDLDEAAFRNQFVKSIELPPLQNLRKLGWIGNPRLLKFGAEEQACTAELLRRDLCAHLKRTCRIDVEKVVARHRCRLSQRLCAACGLQDGVDREAFQVCGACGEASYCSRSCQILDWEAGHSKTCTQRRRKLSERYCSYCYKYGDIAEEPFSLCGGCDERRYCSTNCAYVDWHFGRGDGAHHLTCPGAKAASESRENAMAKWRERNQRLSRFRCGVVNL